MKYTLVRHKALHKLKKRKSVRADAGELDGKHTYLKDSRGHKLAFVYTACRKASENKSTNKSSGRKSIKLLSDLPSRTLPDKSDANSAIRMAPYTAGKVPNIAFYIANDYSVVDTFASILGYINVRKNKGGHTGVGT